MATGDIDFGDIPDPVRRPAAPPPAPPPAPDEASPTRAETTRRRWIAIGIAVVWIVGFVGTVLGLRPDLMRAEVIVQLAAWTIALPLGLAVALRPRASGWPASVVAVRAMLAAILGVFIGLALMPMAGIGAPLTFRTIGVCLSFALALSLPPLVGAAFVLRRAFVNAPALRGALVGAVCGLAGSVGIHSHCPIVTVSHVLLAHGLPVVVLAVLGALIGARRGRV